MIMSLTVLSLRCVVLTQGHQITQLNIPPCPNYYRRSTWCLPCTIHFERRERRRGTSENSHCLWNCLWQI